MGYPSDVGLKNWGKGGRYDGDATDYVPSRPVGKADEGMPLRKRRPEPDVMTSDGLDVANALVALELESELATGIDTSTSIDTSASSSTDTSSPFDGGGESGGGGATSDW